MRAKYDLDERRQKAREERAKWRQIGEARRREKLRNNVSTVNERETKSKKRD